MKYILAEWAVNLFEKIVWLLLEKCQLGRFVMCFLGYLILLISMQIIPRIFPFQILL